MLIGRILSIFCVRFTILHHIRVNLIFIFLPCILFYNSTLSLFYVLLLSIIPSERPILLLISFKLWSSLITPSGFLFWHTSWIIQIMSSIWSLHLSLRRWVTNRTDRVTTSTILFNLTSSPNVTRRWNWTWSLNWSWRRTWSLNWSWRRSWSLNWSRNWSWMRTIYPISVVFFQHLK